MHQLVCLFIKVSEFVSKMNHLIWPHQNRVSDAQVTSNCHDLTKHEVKPALALYDQVLFTRPGMQEYAVAQVYDSLDRNLLL